MKMRSIFYIQHRAGRVIDHHGDRQNDFVGREAKYKGGKDGSV